MKIVVFGTNDPSSLAWYFLEHDSDHEVVAFTVDAPYLKADKLHGLPVVPFDDIEAQYPPDTYSMAVTVGVNQVNGLRKRKYLEAKEKGYGFVSYVSSRAMVWPDLQVGENSFVHDGVMLQPFARIGNNCIIRTGAFISHHAVIADHCYVAGMATVGGNARIGERVFLGFNCTIAGPLTIAENCIIAAGAVVTGDTEPNSVYAGNPARRRPIPADRVRFR